MTNSFELVRDSVLLPTPTFHQTVQTLPRATKSRLIGRLSSTVHVWGRVDDRKQLSDMAGQLLSSYFAIKNIDGLHFSAEVNESSIDSNRDNSTDEELYHFIIYLFYKFY